MTQLVEIFLCVRKVPIHAVITIVGDNLAMQDARLSVAIYLSCLPGTFWFQHNMSFNSNVFLISVFLIFSLIYSFSIIH